MNEGGVDKWEDLSNWQEPKNAPYFLNFKYLGQNMFSLNFTISYVWGSPQKTGLVIVNGVPTLITPNLFVALSNIRDYSKHLTI